ncbi:hypothetical protein OROHE_005882 [Orobanche hederae]
MSSSTNPFMSSSTNPFMSSSTDFPPDSTNTRNGNVRKKWPKLTIEKRTQIVQILLQNYNEKDKKLQWGIVKKTAEQFHVTVRTINNIWSKERNLINMQSNMRGNVGRKRIQVDINKLKDIPVHRRKTQKSVAAAMGISQSTVTRWLKRKQIKRHSNAIKPLLIEGGKIKRLEFCLNHIVPSSLPNNPTFHDMHDHIHIDEKWFYLEKDSTTIYTHPNEFDPYRAVQNKNYKPKLMFLAVVGHPIIKPDGEVIWDGKVGIFPFVYEEAAVRASKNRPAGTIQLKPILSVTRDVVKEMMIKQVLPAIKAKCPPTSPKRIIIQQDNAKPHLHVNDLDFIAAATQDGWDIQLRCQPPNSPDLNVLDLGFFRAIDSLKDQKASRNLKELLGHVQEAYDELHAQTLNKVWLSLQCVMQQILICRGSNNFRLVHIGKDRLLKQGVLPSVIAISLELYESASTHIKTAKTLLQVTSSRSRSRGNARSSQAEAPSQHESQQESQQEAYQESQTEIGEGEAHWVIDER